MPRLRALTRLLALALPVTLLTVVDLGSAPTASASDVVIARKGELRSRDSLGTGSGTGALRLASASVRADTRKERVHATVRLDAAPTAETEATLVVAFGPVDDGVCVLDDFLDGDQYSTSTVDLADGWSRDGRTLRLDLAAEEAGYQPWECAGAILGVGDEVVSFLGGDLTLVHLKPKLQIRPVKILDKRVTGKLGLVRGAQHVIRVPVRGRNVVDARNVVVRGSGPGLKVGTAKVGRVWGESTREVPLTVRATGGKVGRLRLVVTSANGRTVKRTVPVRLVKAPKAPAPGSYRSPDGDVTFRVTGGRQPKVTGFRVYARTVCQPPLQYPVYSNNYYTFGKVKVGGGGVVDARREGKNYSVALRLKIVGGKVTQGRFSYVGPQASHCSATETFTARRR